MVNQVAGGKEWALQTPSLETVRQLTDSLDCPPTLASVLANRGLTDPEHAARFLDPSPADIHHPNSLPEISEAVERLERSLDREEGIVVYADRDIDGISGAAILVKLLDDLGADVDARVPGKWDGYGLSVEAVDEIASQSVGLLLTVDCGTTAFDEIDRAQTAGIDVVVTDHHRTEGEIPDCVACVNPRREDSEYPHDALAGGAVAFKVGQALVESHAPTMVEAYHRYALPLAALATLGDYVTLNLENRALVREGFDRLFDCGLAGLVETARYHDVETVRDLSWSLIPFLNAAQEDESGELMLELVLTEDSARTQAIISQLEQYREERKRRRRERQAHLEDCFERQVDPQDDDIFLVETEEYVGGVPTVRLSEQWGRPVITYRRKNGYYQGGGRSDPDVDFLQLYETCSDLLDEFWGHPGAAGFRIAADKLDKLRERLAEAVDTHYDPEDLRPRIEIDGRLDPDEFDRSLVDELDRLQPFGNGNDEPIFLLEGLDVEGYERFGDGNVHCKLAPADTDSFSVVFWDGAEAIERVNHPTTYDLVGTVGVDAYEGKPTLTVSDYRVVEDGSTGG